MNFLIAALLFIFLALLILPINVLIPDKPLHNLLILLHADSMGKKNNWTYIDSFLIFSEKLFKLSQLKLKSERYNKYKKRLVLADLIDKVSIECFMGLKLFFASATALFLLLMLLLDPSFLNFVMLIAAPCIAYFCPDNIVYGRGKKRQVQMQIELPNVLNTLAIITDSGLNFTEALKKICEIKSGTLIMEIKKAQNEIEVGVLQKNSLYRMAERCQLDEISIFVFALVQSLEKGASGISDFLKDQASELWEKRKNKAREFGEKASMKLFLPMLLLVFPCFLIFLIGPAFITLIKHFSI